MRACICPHTYTCQCIYTDCLCRCTCTGVRDRMRKGVANVFGIQKQERLYAHTDPSGIQPTGWRSICACHGWYRAPPETMTEFLMLSLNARGLQEKKETFTHTLHVTEFLRWKKERGLTVLCLQDHNIPSSRKKDLQRLGV